MRKSECCIMWNLVDLAPNVTVEAQTVAQVKTSGDASENSWLEVASLTVSAKRQVFRTINRSDVTAAVVSDKPGSWHNWHSANHRPPRLCEWLGRANSSGENHGKYLQRITEQTLGQIFWKGLNWCCWRWSLKETGRICLSRIFLCRSLFCLLIIKRCGGQGRGHAHPPAVIPGHDQTLDFIGGKAKASIALASESEF